MGVLLSPKRPRRINNVYNVYNVYAAQVYKKQIVAMKKSLVLMQHQYKYPEPVINTK
ncbi:MAG: hypothetical protein ABI813_12810 [Bacteroidota bacterium]